jgi:hypothetical protein
MDLALVLRVPGTTPPGPCGGFGGERIVIKSAATTARPRTPLLRHPARRRQPNRPAQTHHQERFQIRDRRISLGPKTGQAFKRVCE